MMMLKYIVAVILSSSFTLLALGQFVELESSSGAIFRSRDAPSSSVTGCEMCLEYYQREHGFREGYFVAHPIEFIELNATGGECCKTALGTVCYPGGCNLHTIYRFPNFLNKNHSDSHLLFSGYMGTQTNLLLPTAECDPEDEAWNICSYTELEYTLYNEEQQIDIGVDGATFRVRRDSVGARLRIESWNFDPASTGLRFKVGLAVNDVSGRDWTVQPQDVLNPENTVEGFEYVSLQDNRDRHGAMSFSHIAVVDGVVVNATVSGLFEYSRAYSRAIYIDVPKFDNYMELHYNMFFPTLTGDNASTSLQYSFMCLCIALVALYWL